MMTEFVTRAPLPMRTPWKITEFFTSPKTIEPSLTIERLTSASLPT